MLLTSIATRLNRLNVTYNLNMCNTNYLFSHTKYKSACLIRESPPTTFDTAKIQT